ncbi:hypothetical protein CMI47_00855 [Candidatus Pacearchaeota archaeon]|nr:hypothetical protein [Candidatus Pacearchaeota archaeon]|tara:strand:+ start:627 stop:911 length:285 start_codon:yes stop_codon:yes gene_type:complete
MSSETTKTEWMYRIWMTVLTLVVVPTFIWVWNTDRSGVEDRALHQVQLEGLERRVGKTEVELEMLDEINSNQAVMTRDIEYIRAAVDEIKDGLR